MPPSERSDFESIVDLSERIAWRVDDLIRADEKLDFTKAFVPDSLVSATPLPLSAEAALWLNQIRGNSYLSLFTFVEEYIIQTAMRHANAEMHGDPWAVRALLRFSDEELKHQQLFHRFADAFARDFGSVCEVVDNAEEAAGFILRKSPLGVMLATLHLELITQSHYTDSVRDLAEARRIDPLFASLLKHHWLEEAQHAKIDVLEIRKFATAMSASAIDSAFDDYVAILRAFGDILDRQSEMDVRSLERRLGSALPEDVRRSTAGALSAAYRESFLVAGLVHRTFRTEMERLSTASSARLDALAEGLRGG